MSVAVVDDLEVELHLDHWRAAADADELDLLATTEGPVLDVGCGPGRILAALRQGGRAALGVDVAAVAVDEAVARGGTAVCRSVFEPLPDEGRWSTVLLLDGNVGIGGDPLALLERVRTLLRSGGEVVAELDRTGGTTALRACLFDDGEVIHRFPWATVGVDEWSSLATAAGFGSVRVERIGDRRFGRARRP